MMLVQTWNEERWHWALSRYSLALCQQPPPKLAGQRAQWPGSYEMTQGRDPSAVGFVICNDCLGVKEATHD